MNNIQEFRGWMKSECAYSAGTINSRITNCRKVEKSHGCLDNHFDNDMCENILALLTYTAADKANGKEPSHDIHIGGDVKTGTETYRRAVKLFIEFRVYQENKSFEKGDVVRTKKSEETKTLKLLISSLKGFDYKEKEHRDTALLHEDLKKHLKKCMSKFKWKKEHNPSEVRKDSIDVFGHSSESNVSIIIEVDAHRADLVAKKFLSRTALFIDMNIIYVSLCYKGTRYMSKMECSKYFDYCRELSDFMTEKTGLTKLYAGLYFN